MRLNIIIFICGAVLMALEIVGSRVLSPHFGSSIFVWGSLISVFLGALTTGYFLGGKVADRKPHLQTLGWIIFATSFVIWAIPLFSTQIITILIDLGLGVRFAPLAASIILFFLPGMLLGMVSPYGIRLAAVAITTMGNVSGTLYAISTGGSILGTLLTTFALIPLIRVRTIFFGLGAVLVLISLLALKRISPVQAVSRIVLLILAWFFFQELPEPSIITPNYGNIIDQRDTAYHRIFITETDQYRFLRFDKSWQSSVDIKDPYKSKFNYPDYFHLSWIFKPDIRRVLIIGMGGGTASKKFYKDYPNITVENVEIDPVVVEFAKKYFQVPEETRSQITVEDGRVYLIRNQGPYDLVILDAFFGEAIPFHLMTTEFLQLIKERLTPDGTVAVNFLGALGGKPSRLFRSIYKTLNSIYPRVYVFPEDWEPGDDMEIEGNLIILATLNSTAFSKDQIVQTAKKLKSGLVKVPELDEYAARLYGGKIETQDVPILTDQYAPVEALRHL
jgi:spermidine synthase